MKNLIKISNPCALIIIMSINLALINPTISTESISKNISQDPSETKIEPQATKNESVEESVEKSEDNDCACGSPRRITKPPEIICQIVKDLANSFKYYADKTRVGNFWSFYGPKGSGKRTTAHWIAEVTGAHKIVVNEQDILAGKEYVHIIYERADELAKKTGKPVVIIFENIESIMIDPDHQRGKKYSTFLACTNAWDNHKNNPYLLTIYIYDTYKKDWRGDLLSRAPIIYWNKPNTKIRHEIICQHLIESKNIYKLTKILFSLLTIGFNEGELKNLIDQATAENDVILQKITNTHLQTTLIKMIWREYIVSHKKSIAAGMGIGAVFVLYLFARSHHTAWPDMITNIKYKKNS